jgi:hypothetical protein
VPGVEGAECENFNDGQAGGVTGYLFAETTKRGQLPIVQLDPFSLAVTAVREELRGARD